ncbi:MAG: SH3 domain-containing protein [Thermomicrobiales bacterium]|nr:SH3 domain-containing protein [Thermomicrobiales bacterium]
MPLLRRAPRQLSMSRPFRLIAVALLAVTSLAAALGSPAATDALALGRGNYAVTASVFGTDSDGLVGEETSNGRRIRPFDRLVALPACTESSCPWLELDADPDGDWGAQTACAESDGLCWVQITSEETGECAVAPVLDRGPLFVRDNWWDLRKDRTYYYKRGLPAAEVARDGADLGFGPGISDAGFDIAGEYTYAAAIDLGAGTWVDLGLDPDAGIGDVKVKLLWQAGVSHLDACGAGYGNGQTTDYVNLREGPSTSEDVITVLPPDRRLSIAGASQSGFYLVDVDGQRGWVFADYLRPDGGKTGAKVGFVTDEVNVRAGPSTADEIYQEVPEGSIVVVTGGKSNGFLPVVYDGQAGWISQEWLDLGDAAPSGGNSGGSDDQSATTTDSVNFRTGASLSSSIMSVVAPGETVVLKGDEQNGFYKVTYGGKTGWISGDYLMVVDGESGGASEETTKIVTEALNLRAGPSTLDKVLLVMPTGATVTATGQKQNGFIAVTYKGNDGWAYAQYLD